MRNSLYFIIRPRDELAVLMADVDPEVMSIFLSSLLWECNIVDRSCWQLDEVEDGIKLAFLYDLRVDVLSDEEIKRLGMDGEISSSQFDRYWSIERFIGTQRLEDVMEIAASRDDFPVSNRFLNAKLDHYRE